MIISADKHGQKVETDPLIFDAPNHDDIFQIVSYIGQKHQLDPQSAARFAVGLKLIGKASERMNRLGAYCLLVLRPAKNPKFA